MRAYEYVASALRPVYGGHFAHDSGHQLTVSSQGGEIEKARLHQVNAHAFEHLEHALACQPKRGQVRCECARDRMLGRTREQSFDLALPPVELGARDRRIAGLVDCVVDLAAIRVQRGDRLPPHRRQEKKAVVEARAAGTGPVTAVFLRRHGISVARATMRIQSDPRRTGRR